MLREPGVLVSACDRFYDQMELTENHAARGRLDRRRTLAITRLVAFPVPQQVPQGAPTIPHLRVPGHLPEAVTEESQASEKSEASPSSTEREQRRAVSSEVAPTDHRGGAWTGRKLICGGPCDTHDREEGEVYKEDCTGFTDAK